MPAPVSRTAIDEALAQWDALRPAGENPRYLVGDSADRAALINGMRKLADFLEARPDIPAPRAGNLGYVFVDGTIAEKRAQVDYAASLLGKPVTDDTARGGHYSVTGGFGPVRYEMIATGVGAPRFAAGDGVRLGKEAAGVAKDAVLAQAGYVTGVTEEGEGTYSYTVHFPGLAGTRSGWTAGLLDRAWFEPVQLSTGEVSSLWEAEELLTEMSAQAGTARREGRAVSPQSDEDRGRLCRGLAAACGLEPADLLRQMEPQIKERVRITGHDAEAPKTAPELASGDGQPVNGAVGAVPEQGGDQPAPGKPFPAPVRGKAR